jgi:hypothetical protein
VSSSTNIRFGIVKGYKPPPGMARPLGKRGHQKASNLTGSVTMGCGLYVESPLERLVLLALDIDPRSTYIASQPFTVRLDIPAVFADRRAAMKAQPPLSDAYQTADGSELLYTPDFVVKDRGPVPLVVEVKQERELQALEAVLERRRLILSRLGYRFLVASDKDVGQDGLERNLVFVRDALKGLGSSDAQADLDSLLTAIDEKGSLFQLGSIRGSVSDATIYLGLAAGVIGCDLLSGAFSMSTTVWPAHGDLRHLQLLNLEG